MAAAVEPAVPPMKGGGLGIDAVLMRKTVVRGTRVTVEAILRKQSSGEPIEPVLVSHCGSPGRLY